MRLFRFFKYRYDNLKIQMKLTICILIAVIIPMIILTVLFTNQLYDMVITNTIQSEQTASARTAPLVDDALTDITGTHQQIATLFSSLPKSTDTLADDIYALVAQSPLTAVRIYINLPAEHPLFSSPSSYELFMPMSKVKGTYWYGIFKGSNPSSLHCPSFYLGNRELENCGDAAYITPATVSDGENIYDCYIASYYSSKTLQSILADGISFSGAVSYLINDREALIASTNDSLASIYRLDYKDIEDSLLSTNNFVEREVLGEKLYMGFYRIREPGWFMVTVLPHAPMVQSGNILIYRFVGVYVLCILVALAIAIWQSRSITTRISSVIHQMTKIRKGTPVQMPAPIIQDEVGELINTYNYMVEKMHQLMESQQKTSEELRIAEFESLQAQINPHFLYNTMDMINWMALQGQTNEVASAVQSLAKFYKLTLSRKKSISTIENELEHVATYVELQNMRYHNGINFVIDMPDELLSYSIPKLTLQPIVENSIQHGILEKADKTGTIVTTGWMDAGDVIILISDDGIGISQERLELILSETPIASVKGTNIAVSNIHKRLRLLYGEAYGLTYSSIQGQGTEVSIRLPMQSI
ncbi:MAG: sensor histidine kinase [Faecalimonas sp.]|nr:sensor histidine kinase [Faecalimonas sp.]